MEWNHAGALHKSCVPRGDLLLLPDVQSQCLSILMAKVSTCNALLGKLVSSKWGATQQQFDHKYKQSTLSSWNKLAQFGTDQPCQEAGHVAKLELLLHYWCLKPTNTIHLCLFATLAPLDITSTVAIQIEHLIQSDNEGHPPHGHQVISQELPIITQFT